VAGFDHRPRISVRPGVIAHAGVSSVGVGGEGRRRHAQQSGTRAQQGAIQKISADDAAGGHSNQYAIARAAAVRADLLFAQQHHRIE
jgi:ABC-type taurine transport system ATPase subunit